MQAEAAAGARQRASGWKQWCNDQLAEAGSGLYAWLRNGPRSARLPAVRDSPAPANSDAAEATGPGRYQDLSELEQYWFGLWSPKAATPVDAEALRGFLAPLRELPRMPAPPPLTGESLASIGRTVSGKKAPGADGWRYSEVKDWPPELWSALARLLQRVEAEGTWPEDLSHNLVALLPKGGSEDPGDRRPIVLLATVYRIWAARRAVPLRKWLRQHGLLRQGAAAAPDAKAGELAFLISRARVSKKALSGLAVDWSKCYDRLPLSVLAEVMMAAGVPSAISAPMLAAYCFPRRICVDGVASEERRPTHGLAPGCPAATDWLCLLIHCWRARVNSIGIEVRTRDCG